MNTSILRIPSLSSPRIARRRRTSDHQEPIRAYRRALRAAEQAAWDAARPDPVRPVIEPASNTTRFLFGMLIATATAAMLHQAVSHPELLNWISQWIG